MTETQIQQLVSILDQLAVLLLPLALSWAVAHWGLRQRAEATLARQGLVGQLARTAVRAAEQAITGPDGAARKQYAMAWLQRAAEQHGVKVTPAMLDTLSGVVEAAVRDLNVGDTIRESVAAPPVIETEEAPPPASDANTQGADHPTARLAATPQGGVTA